MPVTLSWFDDQQTILLFKFEGEWTWEEFYKLDEPTWDLIACANYRIDILMDWSQIKRFPLGMMNALHRSGEDVTPKDEGMVVSIGGPYFIKMMYGIFRRLYPKAVTVYRLVDTLDEATHLLEDERGEPIHQLLSSFKERN